LARRKDRTRTSGAASREVHDDTGGTLSLIRLRRDDALHNSERRVGHMEECARMVDNAVRQIHFVARNLRPSVGEDEKKAPPKRGRQCCINQEERIDTGETSPSS
jgi:signal transduction histidine kinase